MTFTDDQIERIAETAAKKAVGELFEIFGVDVSTVTARREFSEDMGFLRVARVGSARARTMTITTIWTSLLTGTGYLIWKGLVGIGLVR